MEKKKTVYALPLLGILAGTVGARMVLRLAPVAAVMARAEKLPLGRAITSVDNLTLAGGLLGLAVTMVIIHWITSRKSGERDAET